MNSHDLVVAYDFDGHIGGTTCLVTTAHHVAEDALSSVTADEIAIVQHLTNAYTIITLGIVPIVGQGGILNLIFAVHNCTG